MLDGFKQNYFRSCGFAKASRVCVRAGEEGWGLFSLHSNKPPLQGKCISFLHLGLPCWWFLPCCPSGCWVIGRPVKDVLFQGALMPCSRSVVLLQIGIQIIWPNRAPRNSTGVGGTTVGKLSLPTALAGSEATPRLRRKAGDWSIVQVVSRL